MGVPDCRLPGGCLFIRMVFPNRDSPVRQTSTSFFLPPSVLFSLKFLSMNLHEYQAKELLKKYNVPVQEGIPVDRADAAEEAYKQIKVQTGNNFAVVKAQI